MDTIAWLLDSDPAISWQAMRDLTDASPAAIAAMRARVAREGIGAEILARQGSDGSWRRADAPVWLPTLFTLLLLRATGVDRAEPAVESAVARLEAGLRWNDYGCWDLRPAEPGGNRSSKAKWSRASTGACSRSAHTSARPTESLARRLVGEQLDDGGWNCEAPKSTRSSFHTTICVLEGLLEYERAVESAPSPDRARPHGRPTARRGVSAQARSLPTALDRRGRESGVPEFAFPPRYHYDVLRALDYLRDAGVQPDARVGDAVHLVESRRQADGRWLLDSSYDEALAVPFGESVGEPSRWNTLRALRVLRWYRQPQPGI